LKPSTGFTDPNLKQTKRVEGALNPTKTTALIAVNALKKPAIKSIKSRNTLS
jgi:hypothetical protein